MAEVKTSLRPPKVRPDFSKTRLIGTFVEGEDGTKVDLTEYYNPILSLGLSSGNKFREMETSLNAAGLFIPPYTDEEGVEFMGGPSESDINKFYKEEKPNSPPVRIGEIVLTGDYRGDKDTAAHEFMHRGFETLRNAYSTEELEKLIGKTEAGILKNSSYEHFLVQAILEKEYGSTDSKYLQDAGLTKESIKKVRKTADSLYDLSNKKLKEIGFYVEKPHGKPRKIEKESFLSSILKKFGFAQGGVVDDMNRQMEMFAVGGLSDDGMTRDPVSGNDIPPGSMAEEVRDDIPAQLSEGEYVVPADVVRFFGVRYFEDLRTEAKMGLSNMEANGRIGGEPVPSGGPMAGPTEGALTPEEMAVLSDMGMNVGGFVPQQQPPVQAIGNTQQGMERGYAPGGQVVPMAGPTGNLSTTGGGLTKADITTPAFDQQKLQQDFGLGYSLFGPTTPTGEVTSMVTLYGPDKQIITLTLPAQQTEYDRLIKEGYTTKQAGETVTTETSVGNDDGHSIEKSDMGEGGKRFSEMDATEIQQAYNNNLKARTVLTGMGLINPAFALIGQATTNFANKKIVERMKALKINPPEDEGYFKNIVTGAKSLVNDLFGGDKDPTKSAVSNSVKTATAIPKAEPLVVEKSDDGKPTDFGGTAKAAEITSAANKALAETQSSVTAEERTSKKMEDITSGKNTSGQVGFYKGGLMKKKKKKK